MAIVADNRPSDDAAVIVGPAFKRHDDGRTGIERRRAPDE